MRSLPDLMDLIDAYGAATGIPDVTISNRVFADSKKIAALRRGADITTKRRDNAVEWFSERWPDGTPWPAHIARPSHQTVQAAE